jgi:glycosyltransferase involved in cell wall biosynthesis
MKRLTVMLLVNDLRIGGAERQLIELARGLDKSRFRVLITTLYPGQPLDEEARGIPGVELRSLERRGKFDPLALGRLVALLKREKVDVIQPFLTPATAFGMTAAMIARTPVKIVTERCGVRLNTHLGNNVYRFVEDRMTRFANAAIPNSEAGAGYLLSRGIARDKVRVIYNGVPRERVTATLEERQALRRELGVSDETWLIGIVASLTPAKDHANFLQAAASIRREAPDTRFLIVGEGPLRAALERRVESLGLADAVIFAGHQLRVAPYIAAMDVAVLSSCDHEGCSNFILEAMGLGRPIVATDVGGNRELVNAEAGIIVPVGNPVKLAAAVLDVMRNPEAADRMRKRNPEIFKERFSVQTMVSAYEQLYIQAWDARTRKRSRRGSAEMARGG